MNDCEELKRQLKIAEERFESALSSFASNRASVEGEEEVRAAHESVLRLERKLAAINGDEYAEPCGFPLRWDVGAPMPHLMKSDYRALLAFLLCEPDPDWDGSYTSMKSPNDEFAEPLGLVEFEHCVSAKLGSPNDEVFEGHPLNGKGMEAYKAQRVVNSRWQKEIEAINRVHRQYKPEQWHDMTHFVFWFHDSTFECIARSFKVEMHRITMKSLLDLMVQRLIK